MGLDVRLVFGVDTLCPTCRHIEKRTGKAYSRGWQVIKIANLYQKDWILDRLPKGLVRITCRTCNGSGLSRSGRREQMELLDSIDGDL